MGTEIVEKKPRKRTRRNYAKELERLQTYLELIIRVKTADDVDRNGTGATSIDDSLRGELKAYLDVQKFMEGK